MTDRLQIEGHKLNYHPDRLADFLAGRTVWPIYAEVSPTSACNHHCRFCNFNHLGHDAKQLPIGRMPALMDEFKQAGIKAVVFAGSGEPSLHRDTFPAIQQARNNGIDAAMSTNGALLRDGQLREMAELLTWTRFSVNGGTPEEYAAMQGAAPEDLNKALNNVEKLANIKKRANSEITIGGQCVLTAGNKASIMSLAARLKDAGADYFSVKYFYPHADNSYRPDMSFVTTEFVAELSAAAAALSDKTFSCFIRDPETLEQTRPYTECAGLPFIVYVREDGRLYTCFSHQDDPGTAVGSLLDTDFVSLWDSEKKEAVFSHINRHIKKNACQANCRHHQINLWLSRLANPPMHVNFI